MALGSWCLGTVACGAVALRAPTQHCAAVIAQRPEATLTYPGARILDHSAHEGSSNVDAGEPGTPWAEQVLSASASETSVLDWYASWLNSHGWSRQKDQTVTDSHGAVVAHATSWTKGDQDYDADVDVSASARARYAVTGSDILVSTQYLAPRSVLGCT